MKRFGIHMAAAFCLIAAQVASASQASQASQARVEMPLPEAHEAHEDMAALAEKGLVPGYEAFDFRGRRAFTREEMAEAVVAVLDHYTNNVGAFSTDDAALLQKLLEEFAPELEKLGEVRAPALPAPDPQVPLNHWAYKTFADFAGRGLLPGYQESSFLGGRIFTRNEMAALALDLMNERKRNPGSFSEKDLHIMAYLEDEFRKEMRALEAAPRPARKAGPAGDITKFETTGSSNLYVGVTKGNKSSVTNRVTLEPKGVLLKGYFSGNADNTDREGADVDFGRTYTFETTRKMLGFHTRMAEPGRDSYLLVGDVNNLDFSRGLSVGATNIKGFFMSAAAAGASRINAVWGEDDADREFLAARYQRESAGKWNWGVGTVKESAASGETLKSASFDAARQTPQEKIALEYTSVESAGYGLFVRYSRILKQAFKTEFEYRRYRDFILEHNNPPMYLGRAGGNGENERSVYGRLEWRPGSRFVFFLSRDHIYSLDTGRKTNLFLGQEFRASPKFRIGWGWEKEQGEGISETERSIKMRYAGPGRASVSASWKRGVLRSGPSSTTRLDITTPLWGDTSKLTYSFTRRTTWTQNTNSHRFRLSKRLRSSMNLTLSYDYSRNTQNRFDLNLTWNF